MSIQRQRIYGRVDRVYTHSHYECVECGFEGATVEEVTFECDCEGKPERPDS